MGSRTIVAEDGPHGRGDRGAGAGRWRRVSWGLGFGAHMSSSRVGELCFNTGMSGYQETLTDPSPMPGQIITFTFPHIGNVGTNSEDAEATNVAALGLIVKQDITEPSNWRSTATLDAWLKTRDVPGLAGVDTRALTLRIRDGGPPSAVLCYPADGKFDLAALRAQAAGWPGLEGMDLAKSGELHAELWVERGNLGVAG